jgi:tetratricopeptide (TPR) repeat protein
MKYAIALAVTVFLGPATLFAQVQSEASSSITLPSTGAERILLNGKVATEANTPPPESVKVTLVCGDGQAVGQGYSDAKGYFAINAKLSDRPLPAYSSRIDNDAMAPSNLSACELVANLAGYTAEPLRLMRSGDIGAVNVGTIVLHSVTPNQTFTVSLTSLAAPDKAKAAFEKGEEQKKKGKWSAAMESFRKAIAAYPKYALAWLELGRVQATQNDFVDARESFHQSINQDSKLSDGYVELAHLAAKQQQWPDLAGATDHLVQIHPESPEYWFLNSAANFNLGNMKQAEVSIARGLRLDSAQRLPQMEFLYGMILARKQDYQSAAAHISEYLKLSPQASDAMDAQRILVEVQKRGQLAAR